jgi:hypothetical protein
MKKSIGDFYKDIGLIISNEFSHLNGEFNKRSKHDSPKEVFLWLDKELKGKEISSELDELLTDFFFSIH